MKRKLIPVLSLVTVFAILFAFAGCSFTEGNEATTTTINVKTPLPTDITSGTDELGSVVTDTEYSPEALQANTVTIFEYFNLHVNEIKEGKAAIKMSQGKSIGKAQDENGDSIPMSDNAYINAAITNLDSYMLHADGDSIEYGDDVQTFLPVKGESFVTSLTVDDIESATCVDNGTTRTVTINLKSPAAVSTIEKAYEVGSIDAVMAEFEKVNAYMSFESPKLTYKNCQIIITADVETDEVMTIEYIKTIDVETTVTGNGNLADIGSVPVIFNYRNNVKYSIDRTDPSTSTTLAEN